MHIGQEMHHAQVQGNASCARPLQDKNKKNYPRPEGIAQVWVPFYIYRQQPNQTCKKPSDQHALW